MNVKHVVHLAWWWRWYAYGVLFTARMTGMAPDMDKVFKTFVRAISVRCEVD